METRKAVCRWCGVPIEQKSLRTGAGLYTWLSHVGSGQYCTPRKAEAASPVRILEVKEEE